VSFLIDIIVGFFAAILSSMGLGAGSVLILYLVLVGNVEQVTAQGVNLVFSIPIAMISIYFHHKNKMLLPFKDCAKISALGVIGAVVGSFIAFSIDVSIIKKLFAAFLFVIGIKGIYDSIKNIKAEKDKKTQN